MNKKIIIFYVICITIFCIRMFVYFDLNQNKIDFKNISVDIDRNSTNYKMVNNQKEFLDALSNDHIKIIEISNDLDLGYNTLNKLGLTSKYVKEHNNALSHPVLKETGVSNLYIQNKDGLVIYSKSGNKLLHTNIRISNSKNIKLYNLIFDELWEWDEKTNFEYDINDWDYITILNSHNIEISHCEFNKSYDGIIDINNGNNVTISNVKLNEIDLNSNFINIQFKELENNIDKYPMYKYLRQDVKLSIDDIKKLTSHQIKLFLIGPHNKSIKNSNIVIHDSYFSNVRTRVPFARNSSVHIYNIYDDASKIKLDFLTKEQKEMIKRRYPKLVRVNTRGVISINRSYIVAENCIFDGVEREYENYTSTRDYSGLGKIIIRNNITDINGFKNKIIDNSGIIKEKD